MTNPIVRGNAPAVNDRSDKPGPPDADYLSLHDLAPFLGERTLRRLARESYLVALDGSPCWEAEHLDDLLRGDAS